MKAIPLLNSDLVAIVDDWWFDVLNKYTWRVCPSRDTFYAVTGHSGMSMHTRITGYALCDHIDRNGLHNWEENLRECTQAQNLANRGKNKNNTSGCKGIHLLRGKYYQARLKVNGRDIYVGTYKTLEEASLARDKAAKEHLGAFAYIEDRNKNKLKEGIV